jgi:hypothetical protein
MSYQWDGLHRAHMFIEGEKWVDLLLTNLWRRFAGKDVGG